MRVLYVNGMDYGQNDGVDAIAQGLRHGLAEEGIEMRVLYADFRDENWRQLQGDAVRAGMDGKVDAIVVYVLDPTQPADAVREARAAGVPVFSIERPSFEVEASIVYANFNHGVYMGEYLASLLEPAAKVAIIGGPPIVDDIELIIGLVHGVTSAGLTLVNDPNAERYKNETDVASGGRIAALNILEDFSHLDGLVPFNDETMMGTLEALREAGRLGEMKMVSRNGTPKAVQAVKDGVHHGTWDLDCPGIGATVASTVAQYLKGQRSNGKLALAPIGQLVTPATASSWVPWSERVPYEELTVGLD